MAVKKKIRGGKREGAGRPPANRKRYHVTFTDEEFNALERDRGTMPRGQFLGHMLMSGRVQG